MSSKLNLLSISLVLISIFYAGLTSDIFFGIRGYDVIIIFLFFIFLNFKDKISPVEIYIYSSFFFFLSLGFYFGLVYENPFLIGGVREWIVLIMTIFVGIRAGKIINVEVIENIFKYSILFLTIIYLALPFSYDLNSYYAPLELFSVMSDQGGRIHGPNPLFITYLYILLGIKNRNFSTNSIIFLCFLVFVFVMAQGRQMFAIMFGSYILLTYYRGYRFVPLLLLLFGFSLIIIAESLNIQQLDRLSGIINPFDDTSFLYRLMSNEQFGEFFFNSGALKILFGHGFGATVPLFLNTYLGLVSFVLLDNTILTLMLRIGIIGTIVFYGWFIFSSGGLKAHLNLFLWTPIIIGTFLSAHILTNPLYALGFFISVNFLKRQDET